MADNSFSEKQSIKDSLKSLKKYGSTCNHMKRPEHYITHAVQKTDTLQGIALKYNTTVSIIINLLMLFALWKKKAVDIDNLMLNSSRFE